MFPIKRTKPNKVSILGGLVLFFCLVSNLAFAANSKPTVGTITPSSGTSNPYQTVTFTSTYSDANGWQDMQDAYFLINSAVNVSNCFYGYYKRSTNQLFLRDSANATWLGGFAPGAANVIQNNQAKLYCAQSAISGSGTTLTIKWSLALKSTFTGAKNTYLYIKDAAGTYAWWTKKGTWSINPNTAPTVGSISPSGGTYTANVVNNFITTYSDVNTPEDIQFVYFLINTSTTGSKCFYGYYNQSTNKLYLRNDANTAWLGGYAPGSNYIIENSYVKLNCAQTTISASGNTLTVTWPIAFKSTFLGTKNMYLYVKDNANAYQGWINKGNITIQAQPADNTPPTGTIKINNDAQYTKTTSVTLNLSATDSGSGMGPGAEMRFSNDNLTWSTPEAYATTKIWNLTSGDGSKTVYVKYKDVAGNWSTAFQDTIILDSTPPSISINPVTTPTNQNVILSYTVTDNLTPSGEIVVTGDNSPYVSEGSHEVSLTAKDLAGNNSTAAISFTIDKTQPTVIITSPENGAVLENTQIQLQGTVDAVSFSETRTLSPGENTLTKTATDAAGNTSSASITVYLYLGQLIGPEGGEVLSADGKVKIVIPAAALNEPQQIKVLTVSNETLKTVAPSGTSLLSVVECKPYGLVFNKPIEIIYTLYQAEIPGTPVELGFYDAAQNKILSTGQTSTVPADGYTITFSIIHFSTYAALKNLTPQSTPIGAGVKIPLPDMLTGAFGHAIPITVPPGRKGIQPALALNYRSSNPNSWVGLGFSLNPGYIVRSTRLGPPKYIDTQDTFYFITDAGATELVWLIDNLYQAKVESSFTKFFKEADDSWRAVAKDGSSLRFGQTTDSKETSQQGTFAWYLTKVIDTNANFIEYRYSKDQGKSYLSRIDYTGNEIGLTPTNSIEFFLEPKDDLSSSYISSAKVVTAKRLKEIQVKVNYDLVWRYVLEYTYSPDTNRSLLKSITQYASDNKSLPKQSLSYQKAK